LQSFCRTFLYFACNHGYDRINDHEDYDDDDDTKITVKIGKNYGRLLKKNREIHSEFTALIHSHSIFTKHRINKHF